MLTLARRVYTVYDKVKQFSWLISHKATTQSTYSFMTGRHIRHPLAPTTTTYATRLSCIRAGQAVDQPCTSVAAIRIIWRNSRVKCWKPTVTCPQSSQTLLYCLVSTHTYNSAWHANVVRTLAKWGPILLTEWCIWLAMQPPKMWHAHILGVNSLNVFNVFLGLCMSRLTTLIKLRVNRQRSGNVTEKYIFMHIHKCHSHICTPYIHIAAGHWIIRPASVLPINTVQNTSAVC